MNCLFCSIIAGDIPSYKLFEDDDVFAFLDIGPVSRGHFLLIPKAHAENLLAGSVDAAAQLMTALHHIAPAVLRAVGAQGFNLGMNHGVCAGQEVLHTHLHVMPRYEGEARTFTKSHPSKEELEATAAAIRHEISLY